MKEVPFNQQLRTARRAQGLTQSALAAQAGCTQSAISMLEDGQPDAVNRETLQRICGLLNLTPVTTPAPTASPVTAVKYCPSPQCHSNVPYLIQETLHYYPRLTTHLSAKHCTTCGELLESACPACGTPVNPGALCTICGQAYITPPAQQTELTKTPQGLEQLNDWVRQRQQQIAHWHTIIRQ